MFPNADFHGNCGAKYMTMDGRRIDQGGVPLAWANTGYDLWRIMYGWVEALNKGAMILPPSQRPGVEGYRSAEELLDVNTGPQKKRKKRAVLNGGVI